MIFKRFHYLIGLTTLNFLITSLIAAEPVKVFLFMGQSNMVGADTAPKNVQHIPPFKDVFNPPKNVQYSYQIGPNYKSENWVNLTAVGDDFGPEITFAHELRKYTQAPIAIIKDAWGGTTLVNDWAPDGGDAKSKKLYARGLKQIRDRLSKLEEKGLKYNIEALMWHQGENDMFHTEGKKKYKDNLEHFIASLRKDLEAPKLKVFVGEISTKGIWGMDNRANVALIRNAQHAVSEKDANVTFVPTSHLSFQVGKPLGLHYHFGSIGQLQHGVEYAKHYLTKTGVKLKEKQITVQPKMPKVKVVKLFILGGQRNMEGEEAWVEDLKSSQKWSSLMTPQKILFQYSLGNVYKSKHWKLLSPVNYLGSFGPELSFGKNMSPQIKSGETMAIYKFTDSGSQSLDWLPEGSREKYRDRYQAWIAGIKNCQNDLVKQGYKCEICGIFWHCGENDRNLIWMSKLYTGRFKKFMNTTRKDLKLPNLKWVLTEQPILPKSMSGKHIHHDLNSELEKLAQKDSNLTFVKTADLPHKAVLFGTEGVIALGERMAKTWQKISKP